MAIKISLLACLFIACMGCTSLPEQQEQALTVSEIVLRSDELDGQHVSVKGWIEIEHETYRLWESTEAMKLGKDESLCVGVTLPKGIDRKGLDRSEVVVHGAYVANVSGRYIVLGGCRERRFILVERIET